MAKGRDRDIIKKAKSLDIVRKTGLRVRTIARDRIVIILIIVVIVLAVFLLYTQIYLSNQSYKIKDYNSNWNQSLADLRSGNMTIGEYCISLVHDEDFCNQFKSLQYH